MTWRWALRGVCTSAALTIFLACAKGEDGIDVGAVGPADLDGGSAGDARLPGAGDGGGTNPGSDGGGGGGGDCGKVLINELQVDGTSGAEFLELFNSGSCTVDLAGWTLSYRSNDDKPGAALYAFKASDEIAAGDFFVVGSSGFDGSKQGTLASGMGNSGGQVGLLDGDGKVVDAVGYGASTKGQYTEGSAAPLPSSNGSIGRKSAGTDTDDNASDFTKFATPSPGESN